MTIIMKKTNNENEMMKENIMCKWQCEVMKYGVMKK